MNFFLKINTILSNFK